MPINSDGFITYHIPENIKKMLSKEFSQFFLDELFMVFNISLEDFDYNTFTWIEGTGGWYESFASACRTYHKDELFKYYNSLPWYDSDLFDDEFAEIIVNFKLFLPLSDGYEIARQTGYNIEDICTCSFCGRTFPKEKTVKIKSEDDLEDFDYICLECKKKEKLIPLTLDIEKSFSDLLGMTKSDYFKCDKCEKHYPLRFKGKCHCKKCEDNPTNENPSPHYKKLLIVNEEYANSLKNSKSSENK